MGEGGRDDVAPPSRGVWRAREVPGTTRGSTARRRSSSGAGAEMASASGRRRTASCHHWARRASLFLECLTQTQLQRQQNQGAGDGRTLRTFAYQGTPRPWSKTHWGDAAARGLERWRLGNEVSRSGHGGVLQRPRARGAALVPESQSESGGFSRSVGNASRVRLHCFQRRPAYRRSAQGS